MVFFKELFPPLALLSPPVIFEIAWSTPATANRNKQSSCSQPRTNDVNNKKWPGYGCQNDSLTGPGTVEMVELFFFTRLNACFTIFPFVLRRVNNLDWHSRPTATTIFTTVDSYRQPGTNGIAKPGHSGGRAFQPRNDPGVEDLVCGRYHPGETQQDFVVFLSNSNEKPMTERYLEGERRSECG